MNDILAWPAAFYIKADIVVLLNFAALSRIAHWFDLVVYTALFLYSFLIIWLSQLLAEQPVHNFLVRTGKFPSSSVVREASISLLL